MKSEHAMYVKAVRKELAEALRDAGRRNEAKPGEDLVIRIAPGGYRHRTALRSIAKELSR